MARYLACDGWSHIFLEDGREKERTTRFVFDTQDNTLALLDIQRDHKWRTASADEKADLLDSLVNANADALDNPENWGLEPCEAVPAWN